MQKELVTLKEQHSKASVSISEELKGVCTIRDDMAEKLKLCKQEISALTNQRAKDIETMQGAQEWKVAEILKKSVSQLSQVEKNVSSCRSDRSELMNVKKEFLAELEDRDAMIGKFT